MIFKKFSIMTRIPSFLSTAIENILLTVFLLTPGFIASMPQDFWILLDSVEILSHYPILIARTGFEKSLNGA